MCKQFTQIPDLQIGDRIGFVNLATDIDGNDIVNFFPVVQITQSDNERAYFYQYPDGEISRVALKHSWLAGHPLQLQARKTQMLNLSEQKSEFKSALKRGLADDLQVYPEFEHDCFLVKNKSKGTEYQVRLETVDNQVFAKCKCSDFKFRNRFCKHISEVLVDTFFGVTESFGVVINA